MKQDDPRMPDEREQKLPKWAQRLITQLRSSLPLGDLGAACPNCTCHICGKRVTTGMYDHLVKCNKEKGNSGVLSDQH